MSLGPETRFKNRLMPKLKGIPKSHWYKIQQKGLRGTPDILGVVNGRFVALELKKDGGKATTLQEFELKQIEKAGGYAKLVEPADEKNILEDLLKISQGVKNVE